MTGNRVSENTRHYGAAATVKVLELCDRQNDLILNATPATDRQ